MSLGQLLLSVLGAIFSNGLWAGRAPASQPTPYGVYTHFGPINNSFSGPSDLQNQRVQIDIYGSTYLEVAALADLVEAAMDAVALDVSPPMFDSMQITRQYVEPDEEVRHDRIILEFSVWYRP